MLVTVPFILLLLDYWPLERFRVDGLGMMSFGRLVLEKTPFFLLAAVSSVITFEVQRHGGAVSASLTLPERIANAFVSYVRYIAKTFWPKKLSVLYPHPGHWPGWQVGASALFLVAVCAFVVWEARRRRYLAVGWFWFIGSLVPVIGLI